MALRSVTPGSSSISSMPCRPDVRSPSVSARPALAPVRFGQRPKLALRLSRCPRTTRKLSAMDRYDPQEIERRWQEVWAREHTWEVPNPGQPDFDGSKPKSYVLEMLPY